MKHKQLLEDFLTYVVNNINVPYKVRFFEKGIVNINGVTYFLFEFTNNLITIDMMFRINDKGNELYIFDGAFEKKEKRFEKWLEERSENDNHWTKIYI